jgi:hypothetical protein
MHSADDRLALCNRKTTAREQDTYVTEMIGIAIAKQTWPRTVSSACATIGCLLQWLQQPADKRAYAVCIALRHECVAPTDGVLCAQNRGPQRRAAANGAVL